jgi:Ca-activated chloride channel family protein
MRFAAAGLLWLLLALPILALLALLGAARRRRALRSFAGGADYAWRFGAEVSPNRRAAKLLLLLFALGAFVVAAARPQWGTRLEPVTRRGADVVLVLDHSLSMAADDLAPSRLEHARNAIATLLEQLAGDRVALLTFAGEPTLLCPLTVDHAALRLFLDTVQAESMQVPGTALAEALKLAATVFGDQRPAVGERTRAVVLFTDGEDHEGGVEDVVDDLKDAGIAVYAVGCGTTRGAPIPLEDDSGMQTGYKRDSEGRVVTTRLDEGLLELLALGTDGRYYRATASEAEMHEIARALAGMNEREFRAVLRARYEERFQVPLALGLLALLAETVIGDRRRRPTRPAGARGEGS